jgi:hypothetical protein
VDCGYEASLLTWECGQRKGGGVGLPRLAVARIAKMDKRAEEGGPVAIGNLPRRVIKKAA